MLKVLTIPQIISALDSSKNNSIEGIVGTEARILAADLRERPNKSMEILLEDISGLLVEYEITYEDYVKMQEILRYGVSREALVKCVGKIYRHTQQSTPYMFAEAISIELNFNGIGTKPNFVNILTPKRRSTNGYALGTLRELDEKTTRAYFLFTAERDEAFSM